MNKEEPKSSKWVWGKPVQWLLAAIPAAVVIVIDQISKFLIVKAANARLVGDFAKTSGQLWVKIIHPFLYLTFAQNKAGMFSMNYGPQIIYVILPIIAILFVAFLLLQKQKTSIIFLLGLIMGGGIGNLIDRIRLGYVVDWISVGLKHWRFATFNLADSAIVVSVILLLIYEFFFAKPADTELQKKAEDNSTEPPSA